MFSYLENLRRLLLLIPHLVEISRVVQVGRVFFRLKRVSIFQSPAPPLFDRTRSSSVRRRKGSLETTFYAWLPLASCRTNFRRKQTALGSVWACLRSLCSGPVLNIATVFHSRILRFYCTSSFGDTEILGTFPGWFVFYVEFLEAHPTDADPGSMELATDD